jgi:hypothetical protein
MVGQIIRNLEHFFSKRKSKVKDKQKLKELKKMSPTEKMKEHIEWLKTPEGQESIKEYFLNLEKEKQERINYVDSDQFNETYITIYKWVKDNERIDDSDIYYNHIEIDIDSLKWDKFTDSIAEKFEGQEIKDKESDFPKYHYEYKSIKIYFMHGQGTVCWVEYNKENDREEKLNNLLD